jgi:tetratricopeptide (TPR) repeat protein
LQAFDCAVVAMRYAVEDEFAMVLAGALYDGLFRQRQSLPRATQRALTIAMHDSGCRAGTLSLITPALFGAKAAELKLIPPMRLAGRFTVKETGLAYFPSEPEHFVGRVTALTRASAALAAESRRSGVLFHGMAGAGKTSCAVELAYHHETAARFQAFVWYRAPEPDKDISLALRDFALAMEKQLPGFTMVHIVDRVEAFKNWLPRLTEMLESNAVLVVLDNLESLLTSSGRWRDERYGWLVDAVLKPGGLSRAVLTSRVRPADLPPCTEVIPVHALSRDEALLLVRELPNLRRLLDGNRAGTSIETGRELVHRTLRLMQGHPKLIELSEKLADDPLRLSAQLDRAETVRDASKLDAFFRDGETSLDAEEFTASLRDWSTGIAGTLPETARTLFHFVCAIEESDRNSRVIKSNWSDLLKRLGRPEAENDVSELLATLVAAGLVEKKAESTDNKQFGISIHPGVAEAGRVEAGAEFQQAVDAELATTWAFVMQRALQQYPTAPDARTMIVRAGLSAFPYLSRRQEWDTASRMLEQVYHADHAPATVAAVLPRVRRAAEASTGTDRGHYHRGVLAMVLQQAGRIQEAEVLMRTVIEQAAERGEFREAAITTIHLSSLLRDSGRLNEALAVLEQEAEFARRAGEISPWSELWNEVQRLKIIVAQGEYEKALARVYELIEQLKELPDRPEPMPRPWVLPESLLNTGRAAALRLGEWQQVLDLNAQILKSMQKRGTSPWELARQQYNDYGPLLRLKRWDEARDLLVACRVIFERENDLGYLGKIALAFGDLEKRLGRFAEARRFEETALRLTYAAGEIESVSISHFNLANDIVSGRGEWGEVLAHRLAATIINILMQSGDVGLDLTGLKHDLQRGGEQADAALPTNFSTLCATVERIEGVQFRELVGRLIEGRMTGDQVLQQVLATIQANSLPGDAQ